MTAVEDLTLDARDAMVGRARDVARREARRMHRSVGYLARTTPS